jgi:TruD family tRNA pseudouridine synthase
MDMRSLLREPEDFVVNEIIDRRLLKKFSRGPRVTRIEGPYTLYRLTKKNTNTRDAVRVIANELGLRENSIGFAGLKDRFAVTTQYVTIKSCDREIVLDNISLKKIGVTNRHIAVGDLEGNEFVITLHKKLDINPDIVEKKGFPNYFGSQRFGKYDDNQIIGKNLVKRQFDEALKMINKNYDRSFTNLKQVGRPRLKFFLHAYQSFLFNEVLKKCIAAKNVPEKLQLIGADTKIRKNDPSVAILNREKISPEDFAIRDLSMSCRGSERSTFVKTKIICENTEDLTILRFTLPKGSYATVLVNFLIN